MWLLDKLLRALVREGRLVVVDHDGSTHAYGDAAAPPLTIRLTDKGAALHIARDPRVGAGEAYMDGRMLVEPPHDIRDLVLLVMRNADRGGGHGVDPANPLRRAVDWLAFKADQVNLRGKASRNVTHNGTIGFQVENAMAATAAAWAAAAAASWVAAVFATWD